MVYEQQPNVALGDLITAQDWNKIQENLSNTAPAKADRAGQLFVSNAAGNIITINPPSGLGTGRFVLHIAQDGTYGWIDEQSLVPSSGEIGNGTLLPALLSATNNPEDNFILTYDAASQRFTWEDPTDFNIADGSIATSKLADGSVTNPKLATDSVTADKISTSNTPSDEYILAYDDSGNLKWIAQNATFVLSEGDITTEFLADAAVTHDKLAHDSVDTDNLVDNAVENDKIDDNAIALRHISADNNPFVDGVLAVNPAGDGLIWNVNTGDGGSVPDATVPVATKVLESEFSTNASNRYQSPGGSSGWLLANNPIDLTGFGADDLYIAEVYNRVPISGSAGNMDSGSSFVSTLDYNQMTNTNIPIDNTPGGGGVTIRTGTGTSSAVYANTDDGRFVLGSLGSNTVIRLTIWGIRRQIVARIAGTVGLSEDDANRLIMDFFANITIGEDKLDVSNDPTQGQVLGYNSSDEMEWVDVVTDIEDNSIEEVKLKIANDPAEGRVIKYKSNAMSWEIDNAGSGGSGSGGGIELVLQGQTGTSTNTLFSPFQDPMPSDDEIEDNDIFLFIALRNRLFSNFRFIGHYEDHFFGREWKQLREVSDFMVGASEDHISFTTPFGNIIYSKGANNHLITAPPLEEAWDIYIFKLGAGSGSGSDLVPRTDEEITALANLAITAALENSGVDKQEVIDIIDSAIEGDSSQAYADIVYPQTSYHGTADTSKTFREYIVDETLLVTDAGNLTMRAIPNRGTFDNKSIFVTLEVRNGNTVVVRKSLDVQNSKDVGFDVDTNTTYTLRLIIHKHGSAQAITQLGMTFTDITVVQGEEFREDLDARTRVVAHDVTDHFIADISNVDVKAENNADAIEALDERVGSNTTKIGENLELIEANQTAIAELPGAGDATTATEFFKDSVVIDEVDEYTTGFFSHNSDFPLDNVASIFKNRPNEILYPEDGENGVVDHIINEIPSSAITASVEDFSLVRPVYDSDTSSGLDTPTNGTLVDSGVFGTPTIIQFPDGANDNVMIGFRYTAVETPVSNFLSIKRRDNDEQFRIYEMQNRNIYTFSVTPSSTQSVERTVSLYSDGRHSRTYEGVFPSQYFWDYELPDVSETYTVHSQIIRNGNDDGGTTFDITIDNSGISRSGSSNFVGNDGHVFPFSWSHANNRIGIQMNPNLPVPDRDSLDINHVRVWITRTFTENITVPAATTRGSTPRVTTQFEKEYYTLLFRNPHPDTGAHRWSLYNWNLTDGGAPDTNNNVGTQYNVGALDFSDVRIGGASIALQDITAVQFPPDKDISDIVASLDADDFGKNLYVWDYVEAGSTHSDHINCVMTQIPLCTIPSQLETIVLSRQNTQGRSFNVIRTPPMARYQEVYCFILDTRANTRVAHEVTISKDFLEVLIFSGAGQVVINGVGMGINTTHMDEQGVRISLVEGFEFVEVRVRA